MIVSRGPAVPPLRGPLLPVVAGLALCRAIGTAAWVTTGDTWLLVVVSFAAHATVLAAWPLLARHAARRPAFGQARLSNWLVFWTAFLASAALGSWLDAQLWPAATGVPAQWSFWAYEPAIAVLGAVILAEEDATEGARARRKEAAAWALVSDLVASREAMRALETRTTQALHTHLRDRIGRAIDELRVELASPAGRKALPPDPDRLKKRIDHLREEEVRAASHLLHPRLARRGLIPAIRAHVRHWGAQMDTAISVDPAAEAADAPGTGTLTPERRLAAFCLYDAAITRTMASGGARRAAVALRGRSSDTLLIEITHPAPKATDQSIALQLAGVRVASVGGQWQEVREGGTVKVSVELPLAGPHLR